MKWMQVNWTCLGTNAKDFAEYKMSDLVNHPPHYTAHPSGVECIEITEHLNFCIGNAVKYLWRAGLKGDALEDLRKAAWYVQREISRLERRDRARTIQPLPRAASAVRGYQATDDTYPVVPME